MHLLLSADPAGKYLLNSMFEIIAERGMSRTTEKEKERIYRYFMRKKYVRTAALICAAAAALAVSGCGKKAAEEKAETTAGAETSSDSSEADTESVGAGTSEEALAAVDAEIAELKKLKRPDSLGTVKLGKYEGVEISTTEPYTITDADVESYLSYYVLPSYIDAVDDAAKEGDTVNIDYVGKKDGVAFDGGTASGSDLVLGSGQFIDGFEDGLIGHKKGDKVQLDLTFPENYGNADLAGAAVTFDVTINEVKRTPELTDGLAAEIDPEVTTAAEYRKKLKEQLQESEDYTENQNVSYLAINAVVEASEVKPSEEAVDWKVADLIANYYDPMMQSSYGFGLSQMLALQGQSLEDFKADLREVAEESIGQILVMDEIAKEQNLTADEAELERFAENNRVTLEDLRKSASDEDIQLAAVEQMATDYVVKNAKISYTGGAVAEDAAVAEADEAESSKAADGAEESSSAEANGETETAADAAEAEAADTAAAE